MKHETKSYTRSKLMWRYLGCRLASVNHAHVLNLPRCFHQWCLVLHFPQWQAYSLFAKKTCSQSFVASEENMQYRKNRLLTSHSWCLLPPRLPFTSSLLKTSYRAKSWYWSMYAAAGRSLLQYPSAAICDLYAKTWGRWFWCAAVAVVFSVRPTTSTGEASVAAIPYVGTWAATAALCVPTRRLSSRARGWHHGPALLGGCRKMDRRVWDL